jgi:hypothetical protein
LPDHLPVSIEVPTQQWAQTAPALERARKLRDATLGVLERTYATT